MLTKVYDYLTTNKNGQYMAFFLVFLVVVRWLYYINAYTVNLLFWDNWGFYEACFNHYNFINTFTYQHGPHRQGIGFVLTQFLNNISDWNIRYIGFTIGVLLLLTALVFTKVKSSVIGKLSFFDAIIFILVLTPAQFALFTNTPNLSHGAMPSFLLSLLCWALLCNNFYSRALLVLVLNFNLIYSGFGIFAGLITPIIFLLDAKKFHFKNDMKKMSFSFVFFLISLLSLSTFFINYNWSHASDVTETLVVKPWDYLFFIAISYVNFMVTNTSLPFLGLFVVVPIILVFVQHIFKLLRYKNIENSVYNQSLIIFMLMGYSLLFIAGTAYGRIGFGLDGAHASRYIVYLVPSILGAYLHLNLMELKRKKPLIVLFFIVTSFTTVPRKEMKRISEAKEKWAAVYLETKNIEKANQESGIIIFPLEQHDELKQKLNYLEARKLNLFDE